MTSPTTQFRFNPLTGLLDLSDTSGGGGGGSGILTITGDTGGAVGGDSNRNINLRGSTHVAVQGTPVAFEQQIALDGFTQFLPVVGGLAGDLTQVAGGNSGDVYTSQGAGHPPHFVPPASSSPLTTKGDLYGFSTVNARVPVGAPGYVLTANPGAAEGVDWEAISNGNIIGQLQYFGNAGGDSAYTSQGWLKCNGQIVSQATYSTLFGRVGLINPPGQYWTNQTSNTTINLFTVVYGNGVYVAGLLNGSIITSTDAKTWVRKPSPVNSGFLSGTYGASKYFLTGSFSQVVTSTDALTWQTKLPNISSPAANMGNILTYSSGFVGGGSSGLMVTSTDGNFWTGQNTNLLTNIYSLNHGNSIYVAGSTLGQIITSTDAVTWTARTASTTSIVQALVYGLQWVLAGEGGMVKTSTDAISWTAQTTGSTSSLFSLTYGNSLYLVGGVGGAMLTSTDAVTWTARTSQTTSTISTITFGTVFAYGAGGGRIASSTDATTWTNRTSQTTSSILCMIFANSLYVYSTLGGGIGTSTDATTWTARTSGVATDLPGLAYDGALYHATGNNVHITSTDAITWTAAVQFPVSQSLTAALFAGGLFVAAGTGGVMATSTDAFTWTSRTTGTTASIFGLAFGAGVYAYAANSGLVASSTDAITWTARSSFTTQTLSALSFGTIFVASGAQGTVVTSTDGTTWSGQAPINAGINIFASAYNTNLYVLGGESGSIYTSTDALTWVTRSTNTTSSIHALVSGGGLFVGVGTGSTIITSYNAYPYDTSTQFQIPNDAGASITTETVPNFARSLYIKAD